MKKFKKILYSAVALTFVLAGCGNEDTSNGSEGTTGEESKGTVTFGMSYWSSTEAPTEIAKLILEEAGYETAESQAEQPIIFLGMKNNEIDFFMDAWLPYTEEKLWKQYEDDLQKVATSYEDVPLGWVVPSYVEEDSIQDLIGNEAEYDNRVVGLSAGSGMTETSLQMMEELNLDGLEYVSANEAAMMAEAKRALNNENPIVFLGWRPHSMFTQFDLKFLEGQGDYFKSDNVYVISYKGVEEVHPEAYEILSRWSIDVADLEEMMFENEENGTPFSELAQQWVDENRDKVDEMLGK
ncbi:glycine betaine ABC transporter substrate-binding protein [Bacillus sp. FJAT-45350]|uniref:glycine betaine ABC transporter substrate-binding protein n=1 Tax=Bacillus sp. FJAT-45350 TaxID=2011014 RepID=UPI000BB98A8D|nr:glycine betaine ABC transporter substrate-binding protein [Bacillus sp. FJAT-45350]